MKRLTKEDLKGLVGKERIDAEWDIIMQASIDNAFKRIEKAEAKAIEKTSCQL